MSYVRLTTSSLKLSQRTFFTDAANNLAEAGTEEAVWCFNTMGNSTDPTVVAAAWSGWSLSHSVSDVYMENIGSGTGYATLTPPTVTFSGGGGTGAAGTPIITTAYILVAGVSTPITSVTGITITNPGTGYTSAPTITLTGGTGSGAIARARLAATRTFAFPSLDQNATGVVKVWVAGYDGSAVVPIVVAQAKITPREGAPVERIIKIILSKNGILAKGLIAKNAITWNGHPIADSYVSSPVPGVPPFAAYDSATARSNISVGSFLGPQINLGSGGVVYGNVMLGSGVTVTGGSITGQTIGNLTYNFSMPPYPTNSGATAGVNLGSSVPATLPRATDIAGGPAADGSFYYYTNGATIGTVTITAGKKVVIVGTATNMVGGLQIGVSGSEVGSAKIYMDGPMSPGNSSVNTTCWPGALEVYTTTSSTCTISGNGFFSGCLFAPNAELRGNGGGSNGQDLCGSFIVGSVTSNGHMKFHYDEALGSPVNPRAWGLALWTEMRTAAERQKYAAKFNF